MRYGLGLAAAASIVAISQFQSAKCLAKRPVYRNADSAALLHMTGSFRLTLVVTSFRAAWTPPTYRLLLRQPDSSEAAEARIGRVGHRPRPDLRLVGIAALLDDLSGQRQPNVELDSGIVYMGCRDCMDGDPLELIVTAADTDGFYGRWRDYQRGIGHAIDESGRRLPDPAGHFCAVRINDR